MHFEIRKDIERNVSAIPALCFWLAVVFLTSAAAGFGLWIYERAM